MVLRFPVDIHIITIIMHSAVVQVVLFQMDDIKRDANVLLCEVYRLVKVESKAKVAVIGKVFIYVDKSVVKYGDYKVLVLVIGTFILFEYIVGIEDAIEEGHASPSVVHAIEFDRKLDGR